jgi:hypothetical protein
MKEKSARVMIRQCYGRSALVADINIECRPDPKHVAIGAGPDRRLPPPGSYAVQISSSRVTPFKTSKTRGVLCIVRIARGPYAGRDVALRFLFEGPGHIVERDLVVLAKWRRLVGAHRAADPAGLIEALGLASAGRVVILRLEHDKPWRGAVRAFAADVLVDDASAP